MGVVLGYLSVGYQQALGWLVPRTYLARTSHVPGLHLACSWLVPPMYLACVWLWPGFTLAGKASRCPKRRQRLEAEGFQRCPRDAPIRKPVLSDCPRLFRKSRSEERRVGKECRSRW